MKVFIVSDMEGVAGIVKWQQTDGAKEKRAYHEGRELYTEEINAAVRGAKSGGATEIVVMDCHGAGEEWTFNSLIPDKLDPDCEFVVQNDWTEYTELLEQGCDAALFVGMHAKAGTPDGVLAHTVSGQAWRELKFNGTSVGETGINAALCGQWNCPVLLVTGVIGPFHQPQHGLDRSRPVVRAVVPAVAVERDPRLREDREGIKERARDGCLDRVRLAVHVTSREHRVGVVVYAPCRVLHSRVRSW